MDMQMNILLRSKCSFMNIQLSKVLCCLEWPRNRNCNNSRTIIQQVQKESHIVIPWNKWLTIFFFLAGRAMKRWVVQQLSARWHHWRRNEGPAINREIMYISSFFFGFIFLSFLSHYFNVDVYVFIDQYIPFSRDITKLNILKRIKESLNIL